MHQSKSDIHIHSNFSDSTASIESILKYVINTTDIRVIAITDHDTIKGALFAIDYVKEHDLGLEVIIGEEITSLEGHIIGLFLKERVIPGLSAHQTLLEIKKQGGISIASHPFYQTGYKDKGRVIGGLGLNIVKKECDLIDALEIFNGNLIMYPFENKKAQKINQKYFNLATVGGSDAHFLSAVGKSYTLFEGRTAKDLYNSLLNKTTDAYQGSWDLKSIFDYTMFISIHLFSFAIFIIQIKINEFKKKFHKIFFSNPHSWISTDNFDELYQQKEDEDKTSRNS